MSDSAQLAPLLELVAEEAEREAEQLLAAAGARARQVVATAEERAEAMLAGAAAEGRTEGEREGRRRVALAQIEARQEALRLREAALERVLERALRLLHERADGPEGERLLAELVASAARALGDATLQLRVRARERERVADGLPGVGAELVLSDETLAEPGAVVSSPDGRRIVDMTLSGLARRRRDASRQAAARVLFEERSSA